MPWKWLHPVQSGQKRIDRDYGLAFVFLLGFLEFSTAAVVILSFNRDPKYAVFLGFSLLRIGLFFLTLLSGTILLFLAIKTYRGESWSRLAFLGNLSYWVDVSFLLFMVGWLALITPISLLGALGYYFERLRPFLLVCCFLPIQFSLRRIHRESWKIDQRLLKIAAICLGLILLMAGFIFASKLGITPDRLFWNASGMPVSGLQFGIVLLGILICSWGLAILRKYVPFIKPIFIDILFCLALWIVAALVWNHTPTQGHFFSPAPAAPYYQAFPFSDALNLDVGALSVLNGWGIDYGNHTNSPLYIVFIALLHLFTGLNYNLLTHLQVWCLALIPVALYLFGKSFHSRFLGLGLAGLILVEQRNAILLSRQIASVNPLLLTTEVPTMLGLIVFAWLAFEWLRKGEAHPWIALAAGGVLGMASLIRLNPVMLSPVFLVYSLIALWKTRQRWLIQAGVFLAGFAILLGPWLVAGVGYGGMPYFIQKFFEVIDTRYHSFYQVPEIGVNVASLGALPDILPPTGLEHFRQTEPDPMINIHNFPGFVVNHFLHNLLGSFLALPDSIFPADQILEDLALRPYWVEQSFWAGAFQAKQLPFFLINLCLVSLGIGWGWKRWRWAGLVPLVIFLAYALALGFGRTSGSRYIVPINWVVFFYYVVGITLVLCLLSKVMGLSFDLEAAEQPVISELSRKQRNRMWVITLLAFLSIASLVPLADIPVPSRHTLCNDPSLAKIVTGLETADTTRSNTYVAGEVLYPAVTSKDLTFTLLTCSLAVPIDMNNFDGRVGSGQTIIVGLSTKGKKWKPTYAFSVATGSPELLWAVK